MVIEEIKKIDSSVKKLREFAYVVGGVLIGLGVLLWWRGKAHFPYFLAPGLILVCAGVLFPQGLKPLQKAWMTLALLMGWVMTRALLTILFFLAVTPISLCLRLIGKDLLDLRLRREETSYWKPRSRGHGAPSDYERQF